MSGFRVRLFGKFSVEYNDQKIEGIRGRKVQELFSYLLLFRNHVQSRESLCEHLWENQTPTQSKKYLRQTLWRLQSVLKNTTHSLKPEVLADDDWMQINPSAVYWLDVAEFEQASKSVNGKHVRELTPANFKAIQSAINLYKGDLLDGWYQDWCLFERERYQVMYLMLLDKLVEYCETHGDYGAGLLYGAEILRHDHAYERAHRHMMRLYSLAGDRTQALRQYERCTVALRIELDVGPSKQTKELYEQIRSGAFDSSAFDGAKALTEPVGRATPLPDMLDQLERFSDELNRIQFQIKKEIAALENSFFTPK
jgi:DNA-binding SARP family transcriptional activator